MYRYCKKFTEGRKEGRRRRREIPVRIPEVRSSAICGSLPHHICITAPSTPQHVRRDWIKTSKYSRDCQNVWEEAAEGDRSL